MRRCALRGQHHIAYKSVSALRLQLYWVLCSSDFTHLLVWLQAYDFSQCGQHVTRSAGRKLSTCCLHNPCCASAGRCHEWLLWHDRHGLAACQHTSSFSKQLFWWRQCKPVLWTCTAVSESCGLQEHALLLPGCGSRALHGFVSLVAASAAAN